MRTVVQRVSHASVDVDGATTGVIERGLLVFLGVAKNDASRDAEYLAEKITHLRIFSDKDGKMNRNIIEVAGAVLVVSQFTLYGDCRKGRRPSFDDAADPDLASRLYNHFVVCFRTYGIPVSTGVFRAHMRVSLTNDGPVTFLLDSKKLGAEK